MYSRIYNFIFIKKINDVISVNSYYLEFLVIGMLPFGRTLKESGVACLHHQRHGTRFDASGAPHRLLKFLVLALLSEVFLVLLFLLLHTRYYRRQGGLRLYHVLLFNVFRGAKISLFEAHVGVMMITRCMAPTSNSFFT